jgi:transcriptional regulator with XRE-family HTH domain
VNHEFSKMISMLRHERGLSQKRAADDLGISQALLSHYENGVREPKLDFVIRAGEYYDVTTDYLLGISPHRQPSRFPEIKKNDGEFLCYNNALVIHSILEEIGDECLSRLVWEYIGFSLYVVLSHLRRPEHTLGPMIDAAKMRSVSMMFTRMRELAQTPGVLPELTDQLLRQWYPEEYESVCRLEEQIRDMIDAIM